jgi:diguanylate cyclase (GGDEF)-like protein
MATLRQADLFGRLSDTEFGLLLPQTDSAEALACAKRLRTTVQWLQISGIGSPVSVTASLGVAAVTGDLATPPMWFAAADIALYRAKCAGGNRVEIANPGAMAAAIPSSAMTDRRRLIG